MPSRIDVSLIVLSECLRLVEVADLLGRSGEAGSHDKEDLHPKGSVWGKTVWRMNSTEPDASLESQAMQLLNGLPSQFADAIRNLQDELFAFLDVATFFRTACGSIDISPTLVNNLSKRRIGVEFTAYPTLEES